MLTRHHMQTPHHLPTRVSLVAAWSPSETLRSTKIVILHHTATPLSDILHVAKKSSVSQAQATSLTSTPSATNRAPLTQPWSPTCCTAMVAALSLAYIYLHHATHASPCVGRLALRSETEWSFNKAFASLKPHRVGRLAGLSDGHEGGPPEVLAAVWGV